MNYKAVEVIWIFSAGGRTDIEGSIRGPRGPKKAVTLFPTFYLKVMILLLQYVKQDVLLFFLIFFSFFILDSADPAGEIC